MFVARDSLADILVDSIEHPQLHLLYLARYYLQKCTEGQGPENRERFLPVVKDIYKKAWEKYSVKELAKWNFDELFRFLFCVGDCEFFELAASHSGGSVPVPFFHWARGEVKAGRVAFRNIEKG